MHHYYVSPLAAKVSRVVRALPMRQSTQAVKAL